MFPQKSEKTKKLERMDLRGALHSPELSDTERLLISVWLQACERGIGPWVVSDTPIQSEIMSALGWNRFKFYEAMENLRARGIELPSSEEIEQDRILHKLTNPISQKQRAAWIPEIGAKHRWTCFYCEQPGEGEICGPDRMRWVLEHKIPLSRGGFSEKKNIVLACSTCNRKKGSRTHTEFKRSLSA